jgi:dTDP-4-dehydrorhamnose 3,5-epimerase
MFRDTDVAGAKLINARRHGDTRVYCGRLFGAEDFREQGLPGVFVEQNILVLSWRRTLHGLHYQIAPHAEARLVRCIRGAVVHVVLDIRPDSPTFLGCADFTLTGENQTQFWCQRAVPKTFIL